MDFNSDKEPNWRPISNLGITSGYTAPAKIQTNLSDRDFALISRAATDVLSNSQELSQLADRVYRLMQADLRWQSDRNSHY